MKLLAKSPANPNAKPNPIANPDPKPSCRGADMSVTTTSPRAATEQADTPAAPKHPLSITLGRFSAVFLWIGFMLIFGIAKPHVFLTLSTFRLTFAEGVVTAILGLAFLVPLAAGAYDLSIGAMMGLSLVIVNWFGANHKSVPISLVCVSAIGVCCLVGLISGFIVVRFRVNSLIATLGMSQVLTAAELKFSNNRQITGAFSNHFESLGSRNVLGIPIVVIYLVVLGAIIWFVLEHTPVGRYLFAVGGNPEAARLPVEKLTYGSLVASAGIAGLAGVIYAMKVGVFSVDAGPGLLFPALAAVFFGASQFSRRPNVWGTLIAYFALAFGVKGLQIAFGPGTFWIQPLFQGAALLMAVALASRVVGRTRRSRRAQRATALEETQTVTVGRTQ
jgi:ribose transport system permease protein